MSPEAWQRLSRTLDELMELSPEAQQTALQAIRLSDPEYCKEVETLLSEQDVAENYQSLPEEFHDDFPSDDPRFDEGRAGRFTILNEIARGGMGSIYRAEDDVIGRTLAVKVLLPQARLRPDAEAWFNREARITGQLQHPGVPPVHELNRLSDGTPFFVMKLIEGRTLKDVISDPDWSARAIGVFEQIARTIAYAHSKGVIHRDLKMINIMVGAFGEVQVMDWGLALQLNEVTTEFENIAGTPACMSPEQARGEPDLDERCDVFGLGAVLVTMLTREPLYRGNSAMDILTLALEGDTTVIREKITDPELGAIAGRCLAARREDRYRHAGEVVEAISSYREQLQERVRLAELARAEAVVRANEERRRRYIVVGLAAALLLLVCGGIAAWAWSSHLQQQKLLRAQSMSVEIAKSLDASEAERQSVLKRLSDPQAVPEILNDYQPLKESVQRARSRWKEAKLLAESDRPLIDAAMLKRLEMLDLALAQADSHVGFIEEFDALRMEQFEPPSSRSESLPDAELYRRLFDKRGWQVQDVADPEMTQSALRFVLAAALDEWAQAIYTSRQNEETARRLLKLARQLDPDPWRDQVRQWPIWSDAKELERISRGLKYEQQTPQLLKVISYLLAEHQLDALGFLRQAVVHYPDNFWLHYKLGHTAMALEGPPQTRDIHEAKAALRAAASLRPQNARALNSYGVVMGLNAEYQEAEELFQRALTLSPDYFEPLANLGKMQYEQGRCASSAEYYLRALRLKEDSPIVHNNLGASLTLLGRQMEALQHVQRALQLKPDFSPAVNNRKAILDDVNNRLRIGFRESAIPVPLTEFADGFTRRLTKEHPLDLFTLTSKHHRMAHVVELTAGQAYQIDLSGDFDTALRVEDARYQPVIYNDDADNRKAPPSRLVFTPPLTARYRLIATSSAPRLVGSYTLQVRPTEPAGLPFKHQGQLTRRDPLQLQRRQHWVPLELKADLPTTIVLRSPDFRTWLRLYDAGKKTQLASNEWMDPLDRSWSRIDTTPTTTGRYFLSVSTAHEDRVGNYTVEVQQFKKLATTSVVK